MPAKNRSVRVKAFRMPFDSKKFNKGQDVYIKEMDACMAAKVVGEFRGNGEFVSCWISWDCKCRDIPNITTVSVPAIFAAELGIEVLPTIMKENLK